MSAESNKISYELGNVFSWVNTDYQGQCGWWLDHHTRSKIADGSIKYLFIALNDEKIKKYSLLGGIEVIFNSQINGFCTDSKSFPWCLDKTTATGGWIKYTDLISKKITKLDSDKLYIRYDITMHPNYKEFKNEMASAKWGQLILQYRLGISSMPFDNAYLKEVPDFSMDNIYKIKIETYPDSRDSV